MRDDFQFAALAILAAAILAGEVVLAVTNSGPAELHGALLFILGVLGGAAVPKTAAK
jgi:hypothetical protein